MTLNVPYRLQVPFYDEINIKQSMWNGSKKILIDEINRQKRLIYYFALIAGLKTEIEIDSLWSDYLVRNKDILKGWAQLKLIQYLQNKNPSVPGIADKIEAPSSRNIERVRKYWNLIIQIDPSLRDIYGDIDLADENISVDHFVPWQYVAHDELWNLSPTTKNINSMKGNQLPNLYEDFERLAELQHKALMMCNDYEIVRHKFKICLDYHVNSTEIRNSLYQPDIDLPSYRERLYNVIQPVYDSAKMGGFTEWIPRKQRWK